MFDGSTLIFGEPVSAKTKKIPLNKFNEADYDNTLNLLEMAETKCPSNNNFNRYLGSADWGLYSYVMFGTKTLPSSVLIKELYFADIVSPGLRSHSRSVLEEYSNRSWNSIKENMSYSNFINFLRK
jgi:hypothetical protein